jgi:hypothetical protein
MYPIADTTTCSHLRRLPDVLSCMENALCAFSIQLNTSGTAKPHERPRESEYAEQQTSS